MIGGDKHDRCRAGPAAGAPSGDRTAGMRGREEGRLDDGAGGDDRALGDDDDALADEVVGPVGVAHARGVHQPRARANPRVLVDDDAVELDVAARCPDRDAARVPGRGGAS